MSYLSYPGTEPPPTRADAALGDAPTEADKEELSAVAAASILAREGSSAMVEKAKTGPTSLV